MEVLLGNTAAKDVRVDEKTGKPKEVVLDGRRVCRVVVPSTIGVAEVFNSIVDPERGLWQAQSTKPPTWVESDNAALEAMLAEHFGCDVGRKANYLLDEDTVEAESEAE
jgi:hypothetical protein